MKYYYLTSNDLDEWEYSKTIHDFGTVYSDLTNYGLKGTCLVIAYRYGDYVTIYLQ